MPLRCPAVWALAVIAVSAAPALAADWNRYGNARFNYWVDIPPGFSSVAEAENGDGGASESAEGNAKLSVWGGYLTEGNFRRETRWRADQDRAAGWSITFQKQQAAWAAWSGAKDGRIFYERAVVVCGGDAAAYFRLEYDRDRAKAFDPIVVRLGKSLRAGTC